jgi:hypothetical protein
VNSALAMQIMNELSDPVYAARKHGTRTTFDAGCNGPLCAKANRDRSRWLYLQKNPTPKRNRPGSKNPELDKFLDEVIRNHQEGKTLFQAS